MTRTIETASIILESLGDGDISAIPIMVWPDLREANDSPCNKGLGQADLELKYPHLDFSHCPDEWDYEPHSIEAATERAERVRQRLRGLTKRFHDIVLVTHRGLIAFLVQGSRFGVCGKYSAGYQSQPPPNNNALRFKDLSLRERGRY
jgi:broad specificity phosphatase PhoE